MKLYEIGKHGLFCNGRYEDFHTEFLTRNDIKVDGIITSPPYNTSRTRTNIRSRKCNEARYGNYLDNKTNEEYIKWSVDLFNMFDQILSQNGTICWNLSYGSENTDVSTLMWKTIAAIIENTNFVTADVVYWKKPFAFPNNRSPNKLTRVVEPIFIFVRESEFKTFKANRIKSKKNEKYYTPVHNYFEARNNDEVTTLNKATFSSDMVSHLIDMYYQKDDIILDPFMGTGTTAVACRNYGIYFYGSEIDENQVDHSITRLKNIMPSP